MRIGIDAHYVGVRHSGNERYFEGLIRALVRLPSNGDEFHVFSYRSAAAPLLDAPSVRHVALASRSVWWQRGVEIPRHARRLRLEVLHVPFNFLPVTRSRTVVTIHDLGFLRLPGAYTPLERLRMRVLTRLAARRAHHVLTESEFVKQDILDEYGISPDRVTVAPAGVDRAVFNRLPDLDRRSARERLGLPETYLLFVGVIQARKNLGVLLDALATLRARGRADLQLLLAGRRGFRAGDVSHQVRELGLEGAVRWIGSVAAADLVALYSNALALVFPSLLEGFGIPILEAMACGCPVVSSSATALPEVYGDAALSFDPRDPEELVQHISRLLDDAALRRSLTARGLTRVERFSWERTAAIVRAAYEA